MRALRTFIAVALALGATGGSARAARPPLVHLRWHEVAHGVITVMATDRYLAYSTQSGVTLIDQHTHATRKLPASECQFPGFFGGPWMAGCIGPQPQPSGTRLYNIPGGYWLTVPTPASCGTACQATAVGSQWIKLQYSNPDCIEHCGPPGELLQNIRTGEAKRDPVVPGGRVRENLDSPSGTSPLCPPLRYPAIWYSDTEQLGPGHLTVLGQFALSDGFVERLEQCHSSWRMRIFTDEFFTGSRLFLWSDHGWPSKRHPNHGLLLASRRQFNFFLPRRFHDRSESILGMALSGRAIYLLLANHTVWAATVPSLR